MSETELLARITTDPAVCHGKPCIRGLRYPVEFILEMLSGPSTVEQFLADYPDLESDDLKAAHLPAKMRQVIPRLRKA